MIIVNSNMNESRDYPLYHATRIGGLISILNSNKLLAKTKYYYKPDKLYYGLSLTRDYNFAKNWIKSDAIIEFNSNLLNYNYKLLPKGKSNYLYKFNSSKNGKAEEFLVIGDNENAYVPNVIKYISKIYIDKEIDSKYNFVSRLQEMGISAEVIH